MRHESVVFLDPSRESRTADNLLCIPERYYSRAQRPFTERVANIVPLAVLISIVKKRES